ncbi:hypothetical protein EF903_05415 [Streptomyces sp. WAC05292]|uniref:hypothetical protein n=1 Tax=Streptomyces sp. WAC05292 TaxID=2487418 RepID=UPI000F742634|nr:hypothetical protein [Streptomyces sp. WAC05292]RSS95079.1 hypothetical protein EF903_05415 [Streptomyces sp. WAC05292]
MSSLSSMPPSAAEIVTAVNAAGAAAFFDHEEELLFAHPRHVPEERALDGAHILVDYKSFDPDQPYADRAWFEATEWVPDGGIDFHRQATIYTTSGWQPFAAEAARCAEAVAEWLAAPGVTAGTVLRAALAEYGITPGDGLSVTYGTHSDRFDVPVAFSRGAYGLLTLADRDGSLRHLPGAHTGWSILLHDERGEPVGDPVYITGNGDTAIDCAADSAAAAALVADWLTAPVSRHCDCYAQERHFQRHDPECNRYAGPRAVRSAA